jgi:hypothetical protein
VILHEQPDGTWAEDSPPDCEACDLAWDGTPGRVLVGTAVGGRRTYTCEGCRHITFWPPGRQGVHHGIGAAPNGEVLSSW